MKIALHTSGFEFIAEAEIPPFVEPPPVVRWGERTFKFYPDTHTSRAGRVYVETFAYDLPEATVRDPRQGSFALAQSQRPPPVPSSGVIVRHGY